MIRTRKNLPVEPETKHHVRLKHIFFCIVMLLAMLAMVSHAPQDWNALKGGISAPPLNWIGSLGAGFSHVVLFACGIAGYILVVLFLLRAFRLLLPGAGSVKSFLTGTFLVTAGAMLLLALTPEPFAAITHNLGLGRSEEPLKALSGGLIGQFFAAPPCDPEIAAGCLRQLIGMVGTMVVGWIMVTSGGVILYVSDWHELLRGTAAVRTSAAGGVSSLLSKWEEHRAARAQAAEAARNEAEFEEEIPESEPVVPEKTPVPERRSRLSSLLADLENAPEDELPLVPERAEEVEVPAAPAASGFSMRSIPVEKVPEKAAAIETPEVGHQVVRPGEKLRGEHGEFVLPLVSMLAQGTNVVGESSEAIELAKSKIQQTLEDFAIAGRVTGHVSGPRVTRYEITLDPGINVKKVEQIQDNIRMALAATSIRVLAPIPGRSVVGIEVSNSKPEAVFMRSVMESDEWKYGKAEIPLALGKNVSGKPVILDLAKAPHMLVAGATGTGKSVCSNSIITSLLFKFKPDELRLIMVDPKIVEFDAYKKLPHLLTPIINDSAKVPVALRWAANEMDRRYHILASVGVKKLSEFNSRPRSGEPEFDHEGNPVPDKMPLLVIILDELADLMMTEAKKDVETNITRIAQKGRAAGIHIIVATQRPSTNIITGVIKANLPTRLCFQVRSLVDSRVVLDTPGAEKLLGMGDMLVMTSSSMEIERVQGAWVKDDDIKNVVKFVSDQAPQRFNDTVLAESEESEEEIDEDMERIDPEDRADIAPLIQKYMRPGDDDIMRRALEVVILDRKASTSYLQRRLKIGYNRAAELVDQMEERGIVGPPSGSGNKRDILIFDGIDIG
ncbi:MAG: DNA translocase FtsK 4TM domain-containing protein [Lentisphaeria bacterium]|nr:DNA translocase FtsK 4TM domain-containing protein [Lentisphaeria bacterium]